MKELKIGCGKPTGSTIGEPGKENKSIKESENIKEAAPSGWQPGKPILKPGPDLVGKVCKGRLNEK